MKNTVALRFIVSFILGSLGLTGIVVFVWSGMGDVQSQMARSSEQSTSLMHLHHSEQAFASAERASAQDLRAENLSLRTFAKDQFSYAFVHLGMLAERLSDTPVIVGQINELRADVRGFSTLYDEAIDLQDEVNTVGLSLHQSFVTAEGMLTAMFASDRVNDGGQRYETLMAIYTAYDTARQLTQNTLYRRNIPLLAVIEQELEQALEPAARLRSVTRGEFRDQIDGLVALVATTQAGMARLTELDRISHGLEQRRMEFESPQIYAEFSTIISALSESRARADAQAVETSMIARNNVVLIVALCIVLLLMLTLANIVALLRPLNQFLNAVQNIAQGKAAGQLPSWRRDEFGQMAKAVALIDDRGASASRIHKALDRSDMMLVVARSMKDVVYVSKQLEDLANENGAQDDYDSSLAWLVGLDNDLARKADSGVEAVIPVNIGGRHFDARIRPIAENSAHAGLIIQLIDRTATRKLQCDIGQLVGRVIAGDFTSRIAPNVEGGELNEIGQDVNRMCESFERGFADVAQTVAALAHGDLTQRMEGQYEGVFCTLQQDINSSLATLGELIGDITLTGELLASHSGEVAEEADQLSHQTEMQATALRQCSATMREMARAIANTSERSGELRSLSTATATGAGEAAIIAEAARAAMSEIETAASRMRDIVAVINAISFQTKLLALNAAVEAARAGQAGSGFAVVASEVRHLADRAARSAQDISALISTSIRYVDSGSVQVSETGEKLDSIAQSVNDMNRAIISISTMSTEQSRSVEEVTAAISAMDDATQQQSSLAEGGAKRARSLQDSAQRLRGLIAQFQLTIAPTAEDEDVDLAITHRS